ncbi:endolytic transglycosylase MltG [Patescibacteria group bacterium]|nr:endolytic transglycosylase MltG [Patescibacteria group bacterium]MBU2158805.1 endolytic transglycosylase MltG [Patescibacteria group bacterium]MBU2220511.1 endolytic transglycosylase MltG [Patescibacteria group bacterium]
MAQSPQRQLMPHAFPQRSQRKRFRRPQLHAVVSLGIAVLVGITALLSLPTVIAVDTRLAQAEPVKPPFPVTVDPVNETIVEDPEVEALLDDTHGTLAAASGLAGSALAWIANAVASVPVYQQVAGSDLAFVDIKAGYREEEVAYAFGRQLGWNTKQQAAFLKQVHENAPIIEEGQFVPGTYVLSSAASPAYVQELLSDRFAKEISARYSTTSEEVLPITDVLTIASMLERETRNPAEMRLISGIIWNRLWAGMNLQIDATLQYAKASKSTSGSWWPKPVPDDKYIKSAYNTYKNKGLPPGPIANPSTAAVLAALNPKKTDCIFYFHDSRGGMHCTPTYKEHVTLLKKYYGRGK